MKINARTHLEIRLQNLVFTLLFLAFVALLGWLSTRYSTEFDWTVEGRNTLSEASRKVLGMLEGPVTITAYAREEKALRGRIADQVGRYNRHKKDLTLRFINPDTQPDKVRELGIDVDGELIVEYLHRSEKIQDASEAALTNALQRLLHAKDQHVVFLEGHGERSPKGKANHDFGQFGDELGRKGITVSMVNLAVTPKLPDHTDLLVLAGPGVNLLPGEVSLVQEYIRTGGNLLWLSEPGDLRGLAPLAQQLGLKWLPGVVVDASTQLFGINDPTFALVAEYAPHPITMGFEAMTVFPTAAALDKEGQSDFQRTPFLGTLQRSWTEVGPIEGKIQFDADQGERQGPLQIGYALTRQVNTKEEKPSPTSANSGEKAADPKAAEVDPKQDNHTGAPKPGVGEKTETGKTTEQRLIVIGDSDFLANAYLGNGGNLNLGLNLIQWLNQNEQFINIPAKIARDRTLNLSPIASGAIAMGFLLLLPIVLIGTGAFIWFNRRRR